MHQVLDPIDDDQMPIFRKISGITGMKPAVDDGIFCFFLIIQITLEQTGSPAYDLPDSLGIRFKDGDLGLRYGDADRIKVDIPVFMNRLIAGHLCLAVNLFEVDSQCMKEPKNIRA